LLQAVSVLAQPSVYALRQVTHPPSFPPLDSHSKILNNSPLIPRSSSLLKSVKPQPKDKIHNLRHNLEKSLVHSFKLNCLSPILPTVLPWLFSSPNIIFSLTKFPERSSPPFVYRSHFQDIINSYTNPTICYTDGSKTKDKADFAFSINNCTQAHRHRNTTSSFTMELQAIFSCLEHLLTLPLSSSPTPILIISDSLAALSSISKPSLHPLTTRTHALLTTFASNHTHITFIWAPGT